MVLEKKIGLLEKEVVKNILNRELADVFTFKDIVIDQGLIDYDSFINCLSELNTSKYKEFLKTTYDKCEREKYGADISSKVNDPSFGQIGYTMHNTYSLPKYKIHFTFKLIEQKKYNQLTINNIKLNE